MIPISSGRSCLRLTDLLLVRNDLLYFCRALVTWHLGSTFSEIVMATSLNVIKALLLKPLGNKNAEKKEAEYPWDRVVIRHLENKPDQGKYEWSDVCSANRMCHFQGLAGG